LVPHSYSILFSDDEDINDIHSSRNVASKGEELTKTAAKRDEEAYKMIIETAKK